MKYICAISSVFLLLTTSIFAEDKTQPNIILCMADDQGWGDVAYNGHPHIKTPVLDEMSRSGLRLDRFYSAAPVCSPTRASVLTGRHPNRARCFTWGHVLPSQEWTIADALKEKGYATGHFGKWHLGSVSIESPFSPGNHGFEEWFSAPNFFELNPWLSHRGPHDPSGIWRGSWRICAKITKIGGQCRDLWHVWGWSEYCAIVIPWDCKYRPVVATKWPVELVVIVLAFAKVVDDVTKMEEEGWSVCSLGLHIGGHGVSH